jgi:starvation-inducible DNA-binding protein
VVYVKLHNFHWNVVGVDFIDFHEKLQELYEEIALEIDLAERIKMLVFFPLVSMYEFLHYVTLKEAPSIPYNTSTIAYAVADDFTATARYLRKIDEFVRETTVEFTINLIANSLAFLEKYVWFFTAYLEKMDYADSQKS